MHCLVAEDNIINQRVLTGLLKALGHTGVVVENGQQAIDAHSKVQFDVILMDVMMPVMDGEQSTKRIRAVDPHIPIIFCSANDEYVLIELCNQTKANGYIQKPVTKAMLENKLLTI